MRQFQPFAILFPCLLSACSGYIPRDNVVRVTVPAGRETVVNDHASWDARTCTSNGQADITVVNQPQHGAVSVRPRAHQVTNVRDGGQTYCIGRTVDGMAVAYTPAAGFHGTDQFDYRVAYARVSANSIPSVAHDTVMVTVP